MRLGCGIRGCRSSRILLPACLFVFTFYLTNDYAGLIGENNDDPVTDRSQTGSTKPAVLLRKDNASRATEESSSLHPSISAINFLIQPDTIQSECQRGRIWLVILIPTFSLHLARRNALRNSWASVTGLDDRQIRRIFLFGKPKSSMEQNNVILEANDHGDILQGNVPEELANFPLKTLLGLRWLESECDGLELIWITQDDIFVNILGLYTVIQNHKFKEKYDGVSCLFIEKSGRSNTTCSGMAYLASFSALLKLNLAVLHLSAVHFSAYPFFPFLCTEADLNLYQLNFSHTDAEDRLVRCVSRFGKDCRFYVGPVRDSENMVRLWNKIQE